MVGATLRAAPGRPKIAIKYRSIGDIEVDVKSPLLNREDRVKEFNMGQNTSPHETGDAGNSSTNFIKSPELQTNELLELQL